MRREVPTWLAILIIVAVVFVVWLVYAVWQARSRPQVIEGKVTPTMKQPGVRPGPAGVP